jgi:hypothetical protein
LIIVRVLGDLFVQVVFFVVDAVGGLQVSLLVHVADLQLLRRA